MRRLSWLSSPSLTALCAASILSSLVSLSGCQLVESSKSTAVATDSGRLTVQGVMQPSHITKNAAGMPLIETNNVHDLLFTWGYSHASDRLEQMLNLRLLAQGRLAEVHGAQLLNLDRLMRSINLQADAQNLYKNAPKTLQAFFAVYARGINAYLYQSRDALPAEFAKANYTPDYWKAEDSALLFALFSLSQNGNLSEEVLALAFTQHLDADQAAWLLPTYPDEPVALNEAQKLLQLPQAVLTDATLRQSTLQLLETLNQFSALNSLQAPLANSWVVSPRHSANRRSLLALSTLNSSVANNIDVSANTKPTSLYSWINLHSPQLQVAGLNIAGVPLVMSGFNGKIGYSSSAVMADTQDVFIEKLRQHNGRLEYFADQRWHAAQQRAETFFVRGQQPVRETLFSTAHGPLLTTLPNNKNNGFGLALQRAHILDDNSLIALWELQRSKNVAQATKTLEGLRLLPANILLADAQHIAWQVTGTYPNRRNSSGKFPSAGWDSLVVWEGYADPMLYPYDQDPQQGWLSAANQRLTQPGYGMQLSSSWASPERAENLAQQLAKKPITASLATQNPTQQRPWLVAQLQQMLSAADMPAALKQALQQLPNQQRTSAQQALSKFLAINPQHSLSKENATWLEHFLAQMQTQLFKQELQDLPISMQQAFALHNRHSYPAWLDHLLGREDSPFWQTASVAKAQLLLENLLSSSQATSQQMPEAQLLTSQTMLVDFSRTTPLSAASFSSQTDNPNSVYYSLNNGIAGKLFPLPVSNKEINAVYGKQRLTLLPAP